MQDFFLTEANYIYIYCNCEESKKKKLSKERKVEKQKVLMT